MKGERKPLTVTCPVCKEPVAVLSCGKLQYHTAAPVRSQAVLPSSLVVDIHVRCAGTGAEVERIG